MIESLRAWFRVNAYGKFTLRLSIAIGSAVVAVLLSYLPYDTILQAIWVVASSMFMGFVVLRQRLNESDDERYQRLFQSRFAYLQANDPEALNTIFAENIRPRVMDWFAQEHQVDLKSVDKIDAIDSLAKNGDAPGQLLLRAGVQFGRWLQEAADDEDKLPHFKRRVAQYIAQNDGLLGRHLGEGIYFRRIRIGESVPVGIHMFHDSSRLLFSVKEYPEGTASCSLSARTHLFESQGVDWETFKAEVHREFPEFQPAKGGSGPQRVAIPFFVSAVTVNSEESDEQLMAKLRKVAQFIRVPDAPPEDDSVKHAD